MRCMLDTDTCIYAINRSPGFRPEVPLEECAISVIVQGELEHGVYRSKRVEQNRLSLDHFLNVMRVVDLSEAVAQRYGELRATLGLRGELIGPNDLWIAAHSLTIGLPLITNNLREFSRVPDLTAKSWMAA